MLIKEKNAQKLFHKSFLLREFDFGEVCPTFFVGYVYWSEDWHDVVVQKEISMQIKEQKTFRLESHFIANVLGFYVRVYYDIGLLLETFY